MKTGNSSGCVVAGIGGKAMPGWWSARVRDQRGQALVEAAFVVPLLVTLLLGIVYLGRAYSIYAIINHAAREGARYAVAPSCATCGNASPADVWTNAVEPLLSASGLQTSDVTHPPPTCEAMVSPGSWGPCQPLAVPGQETRWSVSLSYPFSLSVPFLPVELSSINISTQVTMRGEERE